MRKIIISVENNVMVDDAVYPAVWRELVVWVQAEIIQTTGSRLSVNNGYCIKLYM